MSGPTNGRRCSVCDHPDVGAIDRALGRDRSSKTDVAVRFGLSPSAVQRHRSRHLGLTAKTTGGGFVLSPTKGARQVRSTPDGDGRCPQCLQVVGETAEALSPEALLRRAERHLFVSEKIALEAQRDADNRLCLLALDRNHKALEMLLKVSGLFKPDSVVIDQRSVNVYATWPTEALEALDAFHAALSSGMPVKDAVAALQGVKTPGTPQV